MCSENLCLHKKTFQPLGKTESQHTQCAFSADVRNDILKNKQTRSSWGEPRGFYIFQGTQKKSKKLPEMRKFQEVKKKNEFTLQPIQTLK